MASLPSSMKEKGNALAEPSNTPKMHLTLLIISDVWWKHAYWLRTWLELQNINYIKTLTTKSKTTQFTIFKGKKDSIIKISVYQTIHFQKLSLYMHQWIKASLELKLLEFDSNINKIFEVPNSKIWVLMKFYAQKRLLNLPELKTTKYNSYL